MSATGTGTNRLIDLARKSDIAHMDEVHFDFNCDMDLALTAELDANTSVYRFDVSNPTGDKLYDLGCQWTANCAMFGRRTGKSSKKFSKKIQSSGTVFRTLPIQSCTFHLQKNLMGVDLTSGTPTRSGSVTPTKSGTYTPSKDQGSYNISTRLRVSEGCGHVSLMDVLKMNQRISEKNIMKWASQMLEILLSYHNVSVCLRQFSADDLLIASDKSVLLLYQTERLMATASKAAQQSAAKDSAKEKGKHHPSVKTDAAPEPAISQPVLAKTPSGTGTLSRAPSMAAKTPSGTGTLSRAPSMVAKTPSGTGTLSRAPSMVAKTPSGTGTLSRAPSTMKATGSEGASKHPSDSNLSVSGASDMSPVGSPLVVASPTDTITTAPSVGMSSPGALSPGALSVGSTVGSTTTPKTGVGTPSKRLFTPPKSANAKKVSKPKASTLSIRVVEDEDDKLMTESERILYTRDLWYNPRTWFGQAAELKQPELPTRLLSRNASRPGSRRSTPARISATVASLDESISESVDLQNNSALPSRGGSVVGGDDSSIVSLESEESSVVLPPVKAAIKIFNPDEKHLPRFFPAVASCEKNKLDIRILSMTVEHGMTETVAEFDKYAEGCREDLRSMGLLILQLLFRRPFAPIELEKYSNLTRFTTDDLNEIISLHKYSPSLRRLVEICFDPAEPHDMKEAKKFGAKIINCSVSYHREIRKIRHDLKEEVANLFNDYLNEPKPPPFWTKEDEEKRKKDDKDRVEIDIQMGKTAQATAVTRVNDERKKLWFELQPKKVQEKILRQKKAQELAEANKKARNLLVHRASFHTWELADQRKWLVRVLYENLMRSLHLKKNSKKLEMYVQNYVTVMLKPIPAMLPKLLVRFGTDYYGLDPNCSKEEREKDMLTCITTFSEEVVYHLVKRFTNRKLYRAVENASLEAERKMEKSAILSILPPDQYVLKKRQIESEYLAANFPRIRDGVKLFASDIVFVNREFSNKTTLMICTAIIEKWWQEAKVREEGENLAACRIQALFHSYHAKRVYAEVLKSYDRSERHRVNHGPKAEGKSQKQATAMDEMLYEQRLRDEAQEQRRLDAERLKEAQKIEIYKVEEVEDGADIIISIDLSFTEFGDSVYDRSNMVTLTKLTKAAIYKNILSKVVTDMIVAGVDEAAAIDSRAGTAMFKDKVDIPPSKPPRVVERNPLVAPVEEAENKGAVSILVADARYPVGREERDGVVDSVTSRIEFMGYKEPKWSRREAEERAERERLGEKHPKIKEGKQLIKFSLRGLIPGCSYSIRLALRPTFTPRKSKHGIMNEYMKNDHSSGPELVFDPFSIHVKATIPETPSGITSRILRLPHMPLPPIGPSPLDHSYALDHPPLTVIDDLRSIMASTTLLDRKWQAEANKGPKSVPEPIQHRIEVQWNPSQDNGSAIKHYTVYRIIDPVAAETSSDGVPFTKKDLRTQIAGRDVQRTIEFQFDPEKYPWRKVAKVSGASHVDLIPDAVLFPPGLNASYAAVYYKVVAVNKCGRSPASAFTKVLHVDRTGDQPTALLDVGEEDEHTYPPPAGKTSGKNVPTGDNSTSGGKTLPSLLGNETAALNAGIDTRPYLDMMISSRPGTVNSSSRPQTNQSGGRRSEQGDQTSGLGATSADGDTEMEQEYQAISIIPVSWIDNIRPHTANKVSLDFYGSGLEQHTHDPNERVHESLRNLPSDQVVSMEKWLMQLSQACPLKPVDNSAELLAKMITASSSTRVENAQAPLSTQILGEKIRQNRNKPKHSSSNARR